MPEHGLPVASIEARLEVARVEKIENRAAIAILGKRIGRVANPGLEVPLPATRGELCPIRIVSVKTDMYEAWILDQPAREQLEIWQQYLGAGRIVAAYSIGFKFQCPCCFFYTLDDSGGYEICRVCGWEDDPFQSAHPSEVGGANAESLIEARANFLPDIQDFEEYARITGR